MSTPTSPCSSAHAEKMKSVEATGRKRSWPCVPFMNPLPHSPPDPTVMRADLLVAHARVSFDGSMNIMIRDFW